VFDDAGRKLGYRDAVSDLDESTMRAIAEATDGGYFRATDADTVAGAFQAIDRERKVTFDAPASRSAEELYPWAAAPGVALIALGYALALLPATGWRLAPARAEVRA
jgi:Ca-activated chloride channel family protein